MQLKIIADSQTPFAVYSGGHASNPGFSSTTGVHISFARMTQIEFSADNSTVEVGMGLVRYPGPHSYRRRFTDTYNRPGHLCTSLSKAAVTMWLVAGLLGPESAASLWVAAFLGQWIQFLLSGFFSWRGVFEDLTVSCLTPFVSPSFTRSLHLANHKQEDKPVWYMKIPLVLGISSRIRI